MATVARLALAAVAATLAACGGSPTEPRATSAPNTGFLEIRTNDTCSTPGPTTIRFRGIDTTFEVATPGTTTITLPVGPVQEWAICRNGSCHVWASASALVVIHAGVTTSFSISGVCGAPPR